MLTILPARWRFITGTTACVNRNVPVRLKCSSFCHSSSVSSSTGAAGRPMIVLPPMALTRMSIRPWVSTVRRTTSPTWAASRPSAGTAWAVPPAARTVPASDSSAALSRSTATTVPPSRPMISAEARPMPLPAAVISATLPVNRMAASAAVRGVLALQPAQQPWPHQRPLAAATPLGGFGRRVAGLEDFLGHRDQLAAARLRAHLDGGGRLQVVHADERVGHRLADRQQTVVAQDERGLVAEVVHEPRLLVVVERRPLEVVVAEARQHEQRVLGDRQQPGALRRHRHAVDGVGVQHAAGVVTRG